MSLTSTTSSSGSSRDSRGAMEEPSGPEAAAENGAGSLRGRHPPNGSTGSGGWLSGRGPLSPFGGRAAAAPVHKLSYLGRVVREIVETERMYVQDLRSIVEVRPARERLRGCSVAGLRLHVALLACQPASDPGGSVLPDGCVGRRLLCMEQGGGLVSLLRESSDFRSDQ